MHDDRTYFGESTVQVSGGEDGGMNDKSGGSSRLHTLYRRFIDYR